MPNYLVAAVADIHGGSSLAPCPAEGARLADGHKVLPGKHQRWLWGKWVGFWDATRAWRQELQAQLVLVIVGDAADGPGHHGTTQQMSNEPNAHKYIVERIFSVPRALHPKATYMVRGTAAHSGGESAPYEEDLAQQLRCVRDTKTGLWSRWHLRLELNGVLFDFQHHGRMGTRPHTRQNVMSLLAHQIWMEHRLRNKRAPDVAFRAHQHQFGDSFDAFPTRVIQLPPWQLKTSYAHAKVPETIQDIGGVLCAVYPDGQYEMRKVLYEPDLPPVERLG